MFAVCSAAVGNASRPPRKLDIAFGFALCKKVDMPTPTELATAADISVPYAYQLLKGREGKPEGRTPGLGMALRIYDRTGERFGPLIAATDAEIAAYRKLQDAA